MRAGAIVGIQDMGAAGLTSSSCEMGGRAGTGVEIDLDQVPQRETGMSAYEIMLSESQERMLIVADAGREREVIDIFRKWELDAVVIGRVTADARLRVKRGGAVVADIPNSALTDAAPVYQRPVSPPTPRPAADIVQVEKTAAELDATFMRLVASAAIASKEWVYRQYDHMVRTNTVLPPGSDAAVIRIKEKRSFLAMTLDSNARYCELDPRRGAQLVIAEACRNLVASGARPLALTNCLNFASPERPEVMWQFSEVVDGMAEACSAFGTPVTGGNVSFYNETDGTGIHPTPVIGMVGIIEESRHLTTQWFKGEGRIILLLGETADDLGASCYSLSALGRLDGRVPSMDLALERRVQNVCLDAIREGLVDSAHDCSDGGLSIAIAESCFSSYRREAVGCEVNLEGELSTAAMMFAETPSRMVLSAEPENLKAIRELAAANRVVCRVLGNTGGKRLVIRVNGEAIVDRPIAEVENAWRGTLPAMLEVSSLIASEESLVS
jgi:phosphoribosylformylglycinamidine synthase